MHCPEPQRLSVRLSIGMPTLDPHRQYYFQKTQYYFQKTHFQPSHCSTNRSADTPTKHTQTSQHGVPQDPTLNSRTTSKLNPSSIPKQNARSHPQNQLPN